VKLTEKVYLSVLVLFLTQQELNNINLQFADLLQVVAFFSGVDKD
jgi:hypothetical protein